MPAYSRETQQQAKNYNLAKQDLMSANILYNAGLYDDSRILSEQAAEKSLKSCPDIFTPYGHNVIDLYQQFSAVYGEHQCIEDDVFENPPSEENHVTYKLSVVKNVTDLD